MALKVGESYKRYSGDENPDVIVIGSGIGGLAVAALLAKHAHKKVFVLERHYVAGGFTHVFERPDYEWDVGLHYIGEVHRPHSLLRRLFDHITDGKLQWSEMDEVYDRIHMGDKVYDFVAGRERFREKMKSYFPQEASAIDRYLELVRDCVGSARLYFLDKSIPSLPSKLFGGVLRASFLKHASKTTREVLEGITRNQELIGVLTAQYGDYGLPPALSSFAIHAMVAHHYFNGGAYPVGGSSQIAASIAPLIDRVGGKILVRAEVSKILVEKDRAVGVQMKDGRVIRAKEIVSDAGLINTFTRLLPVEVMRKHELDCKVEQVETSWSHICLYAGLAHTGKELNLRSSNLWIYPDHRHEENLSRYLKDPSSPLPITYISFPSEKDPTFQTRYPGKSTIEIIGFTPYEWFAPWKGTAWQHRDAKYDSYKQQLAERLLEQLYRYVPQVQGKVDYYELSTPLSTEHFTNHVGGAIYGLQHTPSRFSQKFLRPQTPIRHLYLTGQDITTAGVTGALFGGVLTASAILRKNVLSLALKT
ncbi:MAG: NAD(P)/FAD-dependent oxidoreductase [Deltaproteobacteria bacterium]|nr:NAD(P)/FAD-dependent oxidoreductase [Deltaproteobacteria bacterium]